MGLNHGWRGPNIVRDGLVLYLDAGSPNSYQGSGTTWKDISKFYQNDGTLINSPTFDSGNGGSIVFDGVDDYVNILGNGSGSIFETQTFTISCWVNITEYVNRDNVLWDWSFTSHTQPYYCQHFRVQYFASNAILFAGWNSSGVYSTDSSFTTEGTNDQSLNYSLPSGIHNIVWTRSSTQNVFYVDGVELCTKTISNSINYYNTPIRIGKGNYSPAYFKGNYFTNHFYNRALTQTEITQNFNALRGRYGI